MKLLLPDTVWSPDQLSGASLLYFHEEKLVLTLHPSVSFGFTGVNPFSYVRYMDDQAPPWRDEFARFLSMWLAYRSSLDTANGILSRFSGTSTITVQLSYDRGTHGWRAAQEILESSSLDGRRIAGLIDPFHATDEFFAHLFFEKVLEAQYPEGDFESFVNLGASVAKSVARDGMTLRDDFDWRPIHEYCDKLFTENSLEELLTRAYMFRIGMVKGATAVMLTNPALIEFFASLPVHPSRLDAGETSIDLDVVAWEFFRQLLSRYLDPLDEARATLLQDCLTDRLGEIERLKNKCFELAEDLSTEKDLARLQDRIAHHIRAKVLNEVADLLRMDKSAVDQLATDAFTDPTAWIGIATFLYSLVNGGEVLTASSAIVALSSLGSKAFRQAAEKRKKLEASPYALIYRMAR